MRGTMCSYKISIFTKFFKIYSIYNILLKTIFQTAPHSLTLGVAVPNTINTHEFCPSIISGSKFKIPSQYFAITFGFSKFLSTYIFFTRCLACIVSPTVSFKNSITLALAQAPQVLGQKRHLYTCISFSMPTIKTSWRKNTQKNHHTTIHKKQQIM